MEKSSGKENTFVFFILQENGLEVDLKLI